MKTILTLVLLLVSCCGLCTTAWASCPIADNVQTSPASNSVMVSFAPSAGIGQYLVLLQQGNSRPYRNYSTGRAVIFSGLPENTTFQVRVGSVCGPGDTTYTAQNAVTTLAPDYGCPIARHVVVGPVTSTQATFNAAYVYRSSNWFLNYWPANNRSNRQSVYVGNYPAPTVLSNLLPNTNYEAQYYYSCVGAGSGSNSVLAAFTTLATDCNPVTNVSVLGTNATTASVSFTAGVGNTNFVVACYSPADATRRYVNSTSSPVELTGLVIGQTYYVQVQSICSGSGDAYFNGGAFLSLNFQGVSPLSSSSLQSANALLAYPNPAHNATHVLLPRLQGSHTAQLTLFNYLGQPVRTCEVVPATSGLAEFTLTNLAPGFYVLRLAASDQAAACRLVIE